MTTAAFIDPIDFMKAMDNHWTTTLGNVSSDQLRKAWLTIGKIYSDKIKQTIIDDELWPVIQAPTGTGKTQGLILYCRMLAEKSLYGNEVYSEYRWKEEHPGVLIVTRLIEDAEEIADQINTGFDDYAIAYHHKAGISPYGLWNYPVLVITHKAYENALDRLNHKDEGIKQTWPNFKKYMDDDRELLVVDEALDIVEVSKADIEGLKKTIASIPEEVREKFPKEIDILEYILETIRRVRTRDLERLRDNQPPIQEAILRKQGSQTTSIYDEVDFFGLRDYLMKNVRFAEDDDKNEEEYRRHDERLKAIQYIVKNYLHYFKQGKEYIFSTARLLVPPGSKGPVLLDATAKTERNLRTIRQGKTSANAEEHAELLQRKSPYQYRPPYREG